MNGKKVISRSPLQERAERESKPTKTKNQQGEIDEIIIKKVFKKIDNKPRLAFWDHESAVVLHYLKETLPNFSMSAETARLMRKAIKEEHPDIWRAVTNKLREKKLGTK
ncbi:hypothetical protein [Methanobacterium sp. SMA-27]|uniref:hypothetical protein n=1 Tax=Methanobacterium sp. SMA-27 TaxID=1495336 RepID=UPI00064E81CF|nr:hypothetical protein [Methanobacterium sp. SMA-27]